MKKKLFKILATVFTFSALILGLSACNKAPSHVDANTEKILILDASASMRTTNNGTTRFERAIENIRTLSS